MFENSSALISLDLSSFDLSEVKNMSYMFNGCSALESVIFGETEALNVSDMSYMFKDCRKLKTAEFGGVSVGSIKDMSYMFTGCISLQRLNFGKFNTALLQSLEHTFRGCMNLERIYVGEKWSIKAVASGNSTFAGCEKLVGSVSYAAIGDTSYKAATLNGNLTPVDPSVKIPPVEEEEKKEDNTETEPEKLNFFQRIIQWFKNLFARFFGK
jgi:surface protein